MSSFTKTKHHQHAFSLIELSIVILIIGILIAGVTEGSRLIGHSRLSAARSLTNNSSVASIDNLVLWLETTSKQSLIDDNNKTGDAIEDASTISTWRDINVQTAFPHNASALIGGLYVRDGINDLPTIRFNGTSTSYQLPNNTIPSGNSSFTFIVVCKPLDQGVATIGGIVSAGNFGATNTHNELSYDYTNNKFGSEFRNDNIYSTSNSVLEHKAYILTSKYNATTNADAHKLYINGDLNTSGIGTTLNVIPNNHLIGRADQSNPRRYFSGEIAEIIIYQRSLKETEQDDVENYLSKKWDIILE